MTSASRTSTTSPDLQRLSLKADVPTTGVVDGAWWPESRDLAAELPPWWPSWRRGGGPWKR